MDPSDRDRVKALSDEPDVEAHRLKTAADDGAKQSEDKSSDDAPDVEAHALKR